MVPIPDPRVHQLDAILWGDLVVECDSRYEFRIIWPFILERISEYSELIVFRVSTPQDVSQGVIGPLVCLYDNGTHSTHQPTRYHDYL
jgi:hypothetical protein